MTGVLLVTALSATVLGWVVISGTGSRSVSRSVLRSALLTVIFYAVGSLRGLFWSAAVRDVSLLAEKKATYVAQVLVLDNPQVKDFDMRFTGRVMALTEAPGGTSSEMLSGNNPREFVAAISLAVPFSSDTAGLLGTGCLPDSTKDRVSNLEAGCFSNVADELGSLRAGRVNKEWKFRVGDIIQVCGKFSLPRTALNPGEFDYRAYLVNKRIFVEFRGSILLGSEESSGASDLSGNGPQPLSHLLHVGLTRVVLSAREFIRARIDAVLPPAEGAVFKALIIGERKALDKDDELVFKEVGLYRLIGVTGFHVDFMAKLSERAFRKILKNASISQTLSLWVALAYCVLSGLSVGSMRAVVMLSSRMMAPRMKRRHDALAALSLAGLVIGWNTPYPLLDAGLELSFVAFLGAWFGSRLTKKRWGSLGGIVVSLLPFLAYHFQEIPVAGFLMGGFWALAVAVLLMVSPVLLFLPWTGNVIGWFPYLLVRGLRGASTLVSLLPFSSLILPKPGAGEIAAYYVLVGSLVALLDQHTSTPRDRPQRAEPQSTVFPGQESPDMRSRQAAPLVGLGLASVTMFLMALFRFYPLWPRVVFLSVGQGDSAVVRFKDKVILIDTGTRYAFTHTVLPYLRREGIHDVDLLVLSHLHEDHAGGLKDLCENVKIGTVLAPPSTGSIVKEASSLSDSGNVPILEPLRGEAYHLGDAILHVLWSSGSLPKPGSTTKAQAPTASDENATSLAIALSFKTVPLCIEFWGDSPSSVVSSVMERGMLPSTTGTVIVKVPHHGSVHSLADGFYDRLKEGYAVISVGPNSYGHPSPLVMYTARLNGVAIFRTDMEGAVTVRTLFGKVAVKPFIESADVVKGK